MSAVWYCWHFVDKVQISLNSIMKQFRLSGHCRVNTFVLSTMFFYLYPTQHFSSFCIMICEITVRNDQNVWFFTLTPTDIFFVWINYQTFIWKLSEHGMTNIGIWSNLININMNMQFHVIFWTRLQVTATIHVIHDTILRKGLLCLKTAFFVLFITKQGQNPYIRAPPAN